MKENIGVHPQTRTTTQESLICSRRENINTKVLINIKKCCILHLLEMQYTSLNRW